VVLFAGNNEDYQVAESASLGWDPSEKDPEKWLKSNFPARYIYEKLLPEVVSEHAPGVFYHPGSPWGGGKPTTDNTVGDIHQWNGITLFRLC
jgi:beta-mannosidase